MRVLGVTLGDVTGIGPEVVVKALRERHDSQTAWVVIGESAAWTNAAGAVGFESVLSHWPGRREARPGLWFHSVSEETLPERMAPGAPEAARAAYGWLEAGARLCAEGELDGIVTAPVNKEAILRAGIPFVGQTEVVTAVAGHPPTAMMLIGTDDRGRWLRVMLATTHIPLRGVADALTRERLATQLRLADLAARQLHLPSARVAVCGLNPHAGEGGTMGREELDLIGPAVEAARREGLDVSGPFPADTVFRRALLGEFDVVLAMYHDQGLAPLKLVAFETGVNWTVGLPFVRTSPDHGTAYDRAGRGTADPRSMMAAMDLAVSLTAPSDRGPARNRR